MPVLLSLSGMPIDGSIHLRAPLCGLPSVGQLEFLEGIVSRTLFYIFDVFPGVAMPTETGQFTCVHAQQFRGDIQVLKVH